MGMAVNRCALEKGKSSGKHYLLFSPLSEILNTCIILSKTLRSATINSINDKKVWLYLFN